MSNITETQYETNIPLDLIDRNDKCKNCRFIHTGNDSDGVGEQKCMKYILKNSDNSSCNLTDIQRKKFNYKSGDPPPSQLKDHNCENDPIECDGCLLLDPLLYNQHDLVKGLWNEHEDKLNFDFIQSNKEDLKSYLSNKDNLKTKSLEYSDVNNSATTCGSLISPNSDS